MQTFLIKKIVQNRDKIESWLSSYEDPKKIPLYLSTDIRNAGFKASVVDSNLFPSGFNNICEVDVDEAADILRKSLLCKKPGTRNILLVVEEHTRNKWYLENVHTLKTIIEKAHFHVSITTPNENIFENQAQRSLVTQKGNSVTLLNPRSVLYDPSGKKPANFFDLIVLNHDLMNQIPESLRATHLSTYPSMYAGWHSRLKSIHFKFEKELLQEFSSLTQLDPWFFSCLDEPVGSVNIHEESDRERLFERASKLFSKIESKYEEYNIKAKPFIFLKADYGTYGMGVLSVSDPLQIKNLNRKTRNKLHKGKGTSPVTSYLLQEGVPSIHKVDQMSAEVCLYQIANQYVGSFYRIHENKSNLENLNSPGMQFRSIGKDVDAPCGDTLEKDLLDLYQVLSRIAGIACMKEIDRLEECSLDHEICVSH